MHRLATPYLPPGARVAEMALCGWISNASFGTSVRSSGV